MSSAKRYLVGSLLVATMIGLSGASWAGGVEQSFSKQELKQELQQQQQMLQLKSELQAAIDQSVTLKASQVNLLAQGSIAE